MKARAVALTALHRIDEGAYANLALPAVLDRSKLDERDRGFVTELVYGVTRMQRALDALVDPYLLRPVEPSVRAALRLGAYQLHFLRVPAHAAVAETVACVHGAARGLVNAVLRKVAAAPAVWPDDASRLSYPDWIFERLVADLGRDDAIGALEQMNVAADVTERPDGYVQDRASQWVAASVQAQPGERILDVCAAPGGKATALAATGAAVVAVDRRLRRAQLVVENAHRVGAALAGVVAADGTAAPFRDHSFDRVLVDAPCSGLGVLRRRPDARWRIEPADVDRLAALQRRLLAGARALVRPGGVLVYSVCTLTAAETVAIDAWLEECFPDLGALPPPPPPWIPAGRGARLLPQTAGTDGMFLLSLHRSGAADPTETGQ